MWIYPIVPIERSKINLLEIRGLFVTLQVIQDIILQITTKLQFCLQCCNDENKRIIWSTKK